MSRTVPSPDAPWREIWAFALTYDGYERLGSFRAAADVANGARQRWEARSALPESLDEARCALFFEQRRWRHFGYEPADRDEEYVRSLVRRVRELSGGAAGVRGDGL